MSLDAIISASRASKDGRARGYIEGINVVELILDQGVPRFVAWRRKIIPSAKIPLLLGATWETLSQEERDWLLSLEWRPSSPLHPLVQLAVQQEGPPCGGPSCA